MAPKVKYKITKSKTKRKRYQHDILTISANPDSLTFSLKSPADGKLEMEI